MTQIELQRRYPDSRPEDITDAYMRGFEVGLAMRADENAELRELVRRMFYAVHPVDREKFLTNVAELGVEV